MIYSPLSTYPRTAEFPLAATAVPAQEGQALVRSFSGNTFGAAISTGAAGENFLGFLIAQISAVPFQQVTAVKTERFTLPAAPKTITLSKTPIAGTTFVFNITTGVVAAPDSVTGNVVDLTTAGLAGNIYDVTYRYNLTVLEAKSRNGDVVPGGWNGYVTGTVSDVQGGRIYTDQFDSSKNWALSTAVKLGANGLVTDQSGAGTAINSSIIAVPTVDYPFLGIEFSAY